MVCLDLLDLLDPEVALEKWELLVLLVFPDPQGLLAPQASASSSTTCLR